jgi:tRNA pseudouridine38-40 synthase
MNERNIKIIIKYLGKNYHGWQKQFGEKTIQGEIEKAAEKVFKQKIDLIGSGRTDAGVHALGQTANFKIKNNIPEEKVLYALNSNLPKDIRVVDSREVDMEFHSRYNAIGKTYQYNIYNSRIIDPFRKDTSYFIPYKLDIDKILRSKDYFIGEHDFQAFMATGSSVQSTVRKIFKINMTSKDNLISFNITGNGFLYNMVRIIIGTLIDVGRGKIEENTIENIILSRDRKFAGHTAKAEGLFLKKVYYNQKDLEKEIK